MDIKYAKHFETTKMESKVLIKCESYLKFKNLETTAASCNGLEKRRCLGVRRLSQVLVYS